MVSQKRKETGLELLATHQDIFTAIEAKYLVDKELLAAIWGIETNFGTYQGKKHILRALATLGHQGGRRKAFGRQQLLAALEIVEAGDITGDNIYGSWAGAMGQTQFIPTTYLAYAVDFDGDGRRDVWQSKKDALGSAANYLAISGWDMTQRWGYEVTLPAGFDYRQADLRKRNPYRRGKLWGAGAQSKLARYRCGRGSVFARRLSWACLFGNAKFPCHFAL